MTCRAYRLSDHRHELLSRASTYAVNLVAMAANDGLSRMTRARSFPCPRTASPSVPDPRVSRLRERFPAGRSQSLASFSQNPVCDKRVVLNRQDGTDLRLHTPCQVRCVTPREWKLCSTASGRVA